MGSQSIFTRSSRRWRQRSRRYDPSRRKTTVPKLRTAEERLPRARRKKMTSRIVRPMSRTSRASKSLPEPWGHPNPRANPRSLAKSDMSVRIVNYRAPNLVCFKNTSGRTRTKDLILVCHAVLRSRPNRIFTSTADPGHTHSRWKAAMLARLLLFY